MKTTLSFLLVCAAFLLPVKAQDTLRVLFLGNSYTSFNNLPSLVQSMATSAGKTMLVDNNMPGGFTISQHLNDPTSLAKINAGNWDYVVIQEQSQLPTIEFYRYNDMYPALSDIKALIEFSNPCAKIITYMTWGRRFGGQQCDPGGTYCSPNFTNFNHMQDSLRSAYMEISSQLMLTCAPVGEIWRRVLNDTTLVLHNADNSHPNIDGSYLAACGIFSSIYREPVSGNSYTAGINTARASYYRQMSDATLFAIPNPWNLYVNQPQAAFNYAVSGNEVDFNNTSSIPSSAPLSYTWNFGDGNTSTDASPTHTFTSPGNYLVSLTAENCGILSTISQTLQVSISGNSTSLSDEEIFLLQPNPANHHLLIRSQLSGNAWIEIFNTDGRLLRKFYLDTPMQIIDVSPFPAGIYTLALNHAQQRVIRRLVIAH
jgi:hypothetical protein